MGRVRRTHCRNQFAMLGHLLLLLDAEPETGPRPGFLHADLLEPDVLETGLEQPPARPQEHRHDIEMKLIRQTSTQYLLDDADAAHHLNGLVPRGGRRLRDRRFDAVGDESEGQVLVMLRHDAGWSMRQHEDWHLELVVADEPVGILCNVNAVLPMSTAPVSAMRAFMYAVP